MGGLSALQFSLALQVRPGEFAPRPGQQFSGQVVNRPEGLAIQTPQGSFALPASAGLAAGTEVRVEIVAQQGRLGIRVTPVSPQPQAGVTPPVPSGGTGTPAAPPQVPTAPSGTQVAHPPGESLIRPGQPQRGAPAPAPSEHAHARTATPFQASPRPLSSPLPLAEFRPGPAFPPSSIPPRVSVPPAPAVPPSPAAPPNVPAVQPPTAPATGVPPHAQPAAPQVSPAAPPPTQPVPPQPAPSPNTVNEAKPESSTNQTATSAQGSPPNPARAASTAPVLVPHAAALFPSVASRLLSVVAAPADLNDDFGSLIQTLARALGSSAISFDGDDGLMRWALPFDSDSAEPLAATVRRWIEAGQRTPEGILARSASSGAAIAARPALPGTLQMLLAAMTEDDALMAALRDAGLLEEFQRGSERVIDRATGSQLHNLRSVDMPYAFAALPAMPGAGLRHAQVHIFGDGKGRGGQGSAMQVHLDLDLTELGPLWVGMSLYGGHCTCTFRSTSPETRELIAEHAGLLEDALHRAGYDEARCVAVPWHGDRLQELTAVLQSASGWEMDA